MSTSVPPSREAGIGAGAGPRPGAGALLRRYWPLAGVAGLVALAALELGLDFHQRGRAAERHHWEAAAAAVRAEHRRGDLIVTAPRWADPLGRLALGERMSLRDVTRPDGATYARIFELSVRGHRHPHTRGAQVRWRRRFGPVTVTHYTQQPVPVSYDFYERIAEARVWEQRGGRRTETCPWRAGTARHRCRASWKSVRAVYAEIGYAPHRCVLAHPVEGAERVIEYPRAPLGARLVIWTGLKGYDPRYRARRAVWEYQRYRAGRLRKERPPRPIAAAPVILAVTVDGQPVGRVRHSIHDESWHRHELRLPPAPGPRRVRFTVTTRHAWAKPFCFYARSEGERP